MDDTPWEWDGECSRCFVTLSWDGDPPECEEDALCMDCVWKELEERRASQTGTLHLIAPIVEWAEEFQIETTAKAWNALRERLRTGTTQTEDVDRARSWLRSYEAFDPNGRGQARYPTREQLASLTQTLAAQFAAVRAESKPKAQADNPHEQAYLISDVLTAHGWLDGPVTEAELPEVRDALTKLLTETRAFERRRIEQELNLKGTLTVGPIDSIAALAGELEWQEKAEKGTATRRRVHPAEIAPLIERMEKGRMKYPAGCTVLSLLDEAGEFAHAINKGEGIERTREELLDVAAVAMRLYLGEVDTVLVLDGLVQRKVDGG